MSKIISLVLGVGGQDGSYLSEILLSKKQEVHGIIRRSSLINTKRIDHLFNPESRDFIHYGDLTEGLDQLIYKIKPDFIYNLAAQSQVGVSFKQPVYTVMVNALGVVRLLETIRQAEQILGKKIKYYQASSSEMFGKTVTPKKGYNENSYFHPASSYGCAKLAAYWLTRSYRDSYKMFASNGILFNHSSERRGLTFASRKITRGAARISLGLQKNLQLGNLEAKRDEGHSRDYMKAVIMIMEHNEPDDFVVATGETHTIKDFVEEAFKHVNLDPWKYVVIKEELKRPNEVPFLIGDASKIKKVLGWEPRIKFKELIELMVDNDLKLAENELKLKEK